MAQYSLGNNFHCFRRRAYPGISVPMKKHISVYIIIMRKIHVPINFKHKKYVAFVASMKIGNHQNKAIYLFLCFVFMCL